jgi:hypothetical protein
MSAFDPKRTSASLNEPSLNGYDAVSLRLGGSDETARIHHGCRWRSGNLARDDVRADGQASNCRISGRKCFGLCSVGGCFCGSHARARLGRGPYNHD